MVSACGGIHSGVGTGRDVLSQARADARLSAQYLELDKLLEGHSGCVNTVQWHEDGQRLMTSGDDLDIRIWQDNGSAWSCTTLPTSHSGNVFDVRSIDRSMTQLVSCAADGWVMSTRFDSAGGGRRESERLFKHEGRAHKLAVRGAGSAGEGFVFLSAGEDGLVVLHDLRDAGQRGSTWRSRRILSTKLYHEGWHGELSAKSMGINIVNFDPQNQNQFLVGGDDAILRVFDLRRRFGAVSQYCPSHLAPSLGGGRRSAHVTGAAYSRDGSTIAATYNDDDIYLFSREGDVQLYYGDSVTRLRNVAGTPLAYASDSDSSDDEGGGSGASAPPGAAGGGGGSGHDEDEGDDEEEEEKEKLRWIVDPYAEVDEHAGSDREALVQSIGGAAIDIGLDDSDEEHAITVRKKAAPETIRRYMGSKTLSLAKNRYVPYLHNGNAPGEATFIGTGFRKDGLDVDRTRGAVSWDSKLARGGAPVWRPGTGGPRWTPSWAATRGIRQGTGTRSKHGTAQSVGRVPRQASADAGASVARRGRLPHIPRQALRLPARGSEAWCSAAEYKRVSTDRTYSLALRGQRNADTVKGVSFMGRRSEVVVAGSDTGHIFAWDRFSGQRLCTLAGDKVGAVNCLQGHPAGLPVLATSGLENSVKVWSPCVRRSSKRSEEEAGQEGASAGGAGLASGRQKGSRGAGSDLSARYPDAKISDGRPQAKQQGYYRLSADEAAEALKKVTEQRTSGAPSRPEGNSLLGGGGDRMMQVMAIQQISAQIAGLRSRAHSVRAELVARMRTAGWAGTDGSAPSAEEEGGFGALFRLSAGESDEEGGATGGGGEGGGGRAATAAGAGATTGGDGSAADGGGGQNVAQTRGDAEPEQFSVTAARRVLGEAAAEQILELGSAVSSMQRLQLMGHAILAGLLQVEMEDEPDSSGSSESDSDDSGSGSTTSSSSGGGSDTESSAEPGRTQ